MGVASPGADGTYGAGSVINITVTFSGNVTVTGTPLLEMETGAVNRNASYAQGSGTAGQTFQYAVQTGDAAADLDYAGTAALSLNGGAILDAAGRPANLTLPEPGSAGSLSNSGDIAIVTTPAPADSKTTRMTATIIVPAPAGPPAVVAQPAPFFGGGGGGGGGGARLAPAGGADAVVLYGAAWDCGEGTIQITINEGIRPEVSILSSEGAAVAQRGDGPHPEGRTVYEAPLPGDPILSIRALLADGRAVSMATEAVRTGGQCTGEAVFERYAGAVSARQPAADEPADRSEREPAAGEPVDEPADRSEREPAAGEPVDEPADRSEREPAAGEPVDEPNEAPSPLQGAPGEPAPPAAQQDISPDPESASPGDGDDEGGCLIATAAHGTEIAPQVQRLREVRDSTLLSTESGRAFMSAFGAAYYAFSPQVADLERGHPAFRQAVAALVAPMLHALSVVEAAEPGSERDVVAYGALAISLVAGMYVAAPAAGTWYALRLLGARRRGPAAS